MQRSVGQWWIRTVTASQRHVHGLERLPAWDPEGSVVCVADHRSFFDLYVTTAELVAQGLPHRILFPVRSNFFYDHPLGPLVNGLMSFFAMYPPIFRDRKRAMLNLACLDEAASLLRRGGFFVGLHPEGTRKKDDDPYTFLPAQSGVGRIIHKGRCTVVPVFVNGLQNDFVKQVETGLRGTGEAIHIVFGATGRLRLPVGHPRQPTDLQARRRAVPRGHRGPGTGRKGDTRRLVLSEHVPRAPTVGVSARPPARPRGEPCPPKRRRTPRARRSPPRRRPSRSPRPRRGSPHTSPPEEGRRAQGRCSSRCHCRPEEADSDRRSALGDPVADPRDAPGLLRDVFGWRIDASNPMNYGMVSSGRGKGGIDGGIGGTRAPDRACWSTRTSPRSTPPCAKIEARGGRTVMPRTDVGTRHHGALHGPRGERDGHHRRVSLRDGRISRPRPSIDAAGPPRHLRTVKQYLDLVREVLSRGTRKPNRTGVDTISTFNHNYEIDLRAGLSAPDDQGDLVEEHRRREPLVPRAARRTSGSSRSTGASSGTRGPTSTGRCPSAYGNFWRHFPVHDGSGPDRARHSTTRSRGCSTELKRNPMSRRLVVTAWAPGNAQTSKLPPCHLLFVFNVQIDAARRSPALPAPHAAQRRRGARRAVQHRRLRAAARALLAVHGHPRGHLRAHDDRRARLHGEGGRLDGRVRPRAGAAASSSSATPRPLPDAHHRSRHPSLDDLRPLLDADTETVMKHFVLTGYDPHPPIAFKVAV